MKDFQCVPKTTDPPVTQAGASKAVRNALIAISVVMAMVVIILVAVLLWFWFRSRQNRKVVPATEEKSAITQENHWIKDDVPIISK